MSPRSQENPALEMQNLVRNEGSGPESTESEQQADESPEQVANSTEETNEAQNQKPESLTFDGIVVKDLKSVEEQIVYAEVQGEEGIPLKTHDGDLVRWEDIANAVNVEEVVNFELLEKLGLDKQKVRETLERQADQASATETQEKGPGSEPESGEGDEGSDLETLKEKDWEELTSFEKMSVGEEYVKEEVLPQLRPDDAYDLERKIKEVGDDQVRYPHAETLAGILEDRPLDQEQKDQAIYMLVLPEADLRREKNSSIGELLPNVESPYS